MTTFAAHQPRPQSRQTNIKHWLQWVAANAGAEMIGLGTSALLWIAMLAVLEARWGILLSAVLVVIGSTLLEGTAVGMAQWLVLRRLLPQLSWQRWLLATAVGALVAWTLGMIPSTLISMGESAAAATTGSPPVEAPMMSDLMLYSLAALMGLLLGPILALPQWWVLREHVQHAAWWIPANALAWAVGMMLIFIGIGLVPAEPVIWTVIPIVLGSLAMAGAAVGAIHGLFLLWMINR